MNEQTYDKSFFQDNIFQENIDLETYSSLVEDETYSNYSSIRQPSQGKHVQTFSARVLDWNENVVKTEWLINKEEGKYQVRFFPIEIFEKTNLLKYGQFLKIFIFIKNKEMKLTFEDGSNLVSESDFPIIESLTKLDFPLFKFK